MTLDRRLAVSRAQEKAGAKTHNGRLNPGSGNGIKKNDMRTGLDEVVPLLGEYKTTVAGKATKQITIKGVDLHGVVSEAWKQGRFGYLGFDLAGRSYMTFDEEDILELVHRIERLEEQLRHVVEER